MAQEHQKWLWQSCEHFVPKRMTHICEAVCGERLAAGFECDYGAIRLVADPRNVLVAKPGERGRYVPAILNSDRLVYWSNATWRANYTNVLWRFGSDASIHMPNGLYLTATTEGISLLSQRSHHADIRQQGTHQCSH